MTDRTLNALRRKLEQWELAHLRQHCTELAERLEAAEARARDAEDWAEYWRENAFNLQQELMDDGLQIGLTKEGNLVAIRTDLPTDAQVLNDSVEQVDGLAHEDHAISVTGGGQDHLDASSDRIGGFDIDPMNSTGEPCGVEVGAEQADAVIPGVGNHASVEVSDDHGNSETLSAKTSSKDGQLNAVDGRQQGTADLHESSTSVTWPGDGNIIQSIDWSPLAGRPAIVHPENSHDKATPEKP